MNRRRFVSLGTRAGIVATILHGAKQSGSAGSAVEPVAAGDVYRTVEAKWINKEGHVSIKHPRTLKLSFSELGALYDGSVIECRSNGSITLETGQKINGLAGDRFRLCCIRSAGTGAVRKGLLKARTLEEIKALIASRKSS